MIFWVIFFWQPKVCKFTLIWKMILFWQPCAKILFTPTPEFCTPHCGLWLLSCAKILFCVLFGKTSGGFFVRFWMWIWALRWNFVACNVAAIVSWVFVDQTIPRTSRVQPGPHGPTRVHMGPYGLEKLRETRDQIPLIGPFQGQGTTNGVDTDGVGKKICFC